jgi:hypothetical protein
MGCSIRTRHHGVPATLHRFVDEYARPNKLYLICTLEQGPWSGCVLADRLRWCCDGLLQDERTPRRRLDEAQHKLVKRVVIEHEAAAVPRRKTRNEG